MLRGHRPVARATGGKGPLKESRAAVHLAHGGCAGECAGGCAGTGLIRLKGHISCAGCGPPGWCGALASPLAAQTTTQVPARPAWDRVGVEAPRPARLADWPSPERCLFGAVAGSRGWARDSNSPSPGVPGRHHISQSEARTGVHRFGGPRWNIVKTKGLFRITWIRTRQTGSVSPLE